MRSIHWIRTSFAALAFATASAAAAQSDLANVTDFTTVDRYAIDADSIEAALSADRSTNFRVAPPTALLPIEFEFDSCEPTPPSRPALGQPGRGGRGAGGRPPRRVEVISGGWAPPTRPRRRQRRCGSLCLRCRHQK